MKNLFKIILLTIITMLFFTSSCKYHKLKKSRDPEVKTTAAHDFYERGKYAKALPLYEDIILIKRNTKDYEKILYRYANSYYKVKDYILAGYYFRQFVEVFPKSKYTEDAQFMSAYCYYLDAPKSTLDQKATHTALNEFSKFISRFPQSEKIDQCNELIDELRLKLETKAFKNASLYYDLEQYRSAITALKNSLNEYPDTPFEEKIRLLMLKSAYEYAKKSVITKQKERYENTIALYNEYISKFPSSKNRKQAEKILSATNKELQNL